jgi:hypothetical protein
MTLNMAQNQYLTTRLGAITVKNPLAKVKNDGV